MFNCIYRFFYFFLFIIFLFSSVGLVKFFILFLLLFVVLLATDRWNKDEYVLWCVMPRCICPLAPAHRRTRHRAKRPLRRRSLRSSSRCVCSWRPPAHLLPRRWRRPESAATESVSPRLPSTTPCPLRRSRTCRCAWSADDRNADSRSSSVRQLDNTTRSTTIGDRRLNSVETAALAAHSHHICAHHHQ